MHYFLNAALYAESDFLQHINSKNFDQILKNYKQQAKKKIKKTNGGSTSYLVFLMPLLFISLYYAPTLLEILKSYLISIIKDLDLEHIDNGAQVYIDKIKKEMAEEQKKLRDEISDVKKTTIDFGKNTEEANKNLEKTVGKKLSEQDEAIKKSKKDSEKTEDRFYDVENKVGRLNDRFNDLPRTSNGFGQYQADGTNILTRFFNNSYALYGTIVLIGFLFAMHKYEKFAKAITNGIHNVAVWLRFADDTLITEMKEMQKTTIETREFVHGMDERIDQKFSAYGATLGTTNQKVEIQNNRFDGIENKMDNCIQFNTTSKNDQESMMKNLDLDNLDGACGRLHAEIKEHQQKTNILDQRVEDLTTKLKGVNDQETKNEEDIQTIKNRLQILTSLAPQDNAQAQETILNATNQIADIQEQNQLMNTSYKEIEPLIKQLPEFIKKTKEREEKNKEEAIKREKGILKQATDIAFEKFISWSKQNKNNIDTDSVNNNNSMNTVPPIISNNNSSIDIVIENKSTENSSDEKANNNTESNTTQNNNLNISENNNFPSTNNTQNIIVIDTDNKTDGVNNNDFVSSVPPTTSNNNSNFITEETPLITIIKNESRENVSNLEKINNNQSQLPLPKDEIKSNIFTEENSNKKTLNDMAKNNINNNATVAAVLNQIKSDELGFDNYDNFINGGSTLNQKNNNPKSTKTKEIRKSVKNNNNNKTKTKKELKSKKNNSTFNQNNNSVTNNTPPNIKVIGDNNNKNIISAFFSNK